MSNELLLLQETQAINPIEQGSIASEKLFVQFCAFSLDGIVGVNPQPNLPTLEIQAVEISSVTVRELNILSS